MRHVLQVREIEDPSQRLSISPIDEGVLMHIVLDRFVQTFLPTNDRPDWTDPVNLDLMLSLFDAACIEAERDGRTGRAVFWDYDRMRMQRELGRFLLADAADMELRASMPLAAEFEFGVGGRPAATVTLPDGRVARFTGKVDRVDRTRFKQLIVTDYKTGGAYGYTNLSQENPHANGRFLQLPVYAAAALAAFPDSNPDNVLTRYEFISERAELGRRPPAIIIDDTVTRSVNEALSVILDGLTAGLFPARPDPTTRGNYVPCAYCEPDGLGVTELHRAWLTKRSDERLAAYCRMLDEELDDPLDSLADEESGQ